MINEFKPTLLFLARFLVIYVVGNLAYGAWITHWHPQPDPLTHEVTQQSATIIRTLGFEVQVHDYPNKPTTYIQLRSNAIVSVYEGCNGANVALVFLAFLLAFGPYTRAMIWFAPLGLLALHLANLARIVLLFLVSLYEPEYLYFTHKYLFTAFIYLVAFLLWMVWVVKLAKPTPKPHEPTS